MPASAVQTKTWFRPNGWFTDEELAIVVNRVLRDDPSKGDMHNRQAITPKRLWKAMLDYDLWPVSMLDKRLYNAMAYWLKIYAIGLICYIPQSPPSTYLTLTLRNLGFSTVSPPLYVPIVLSLAREFTLSYFHIQWAIAKNPLV